MDKEIEIARAGGKAYVGAKINSLTDKEIIDKYMKKANSRSCDMSFAAVYLWKDFYLLEYTVCEDMLQNSKGDKKEIKKGAITQSGNRSFSYSQLNCIYSTSL